MGQMKRLDILLQDLDLVREDIIALEIDRAIRRIAGVLTELLDIHSGADRGEPLESATTFRKGMDTQEMLERHEFHDGR